MNQTEFRNYFRDFLDNEERFQIFISSVNKSVNGELKFWQEQLVTKFCDKYTISEPTFSELREIFGICEVLGSELKPGKVKVFNGEIDYSPLYVKTCAILFPNCYSSEVNGPIELHGKLIDIRYCQQCREAEQKWRDANA